MYSCLKYFTIITLIIVGTLTPQREIFAQTTQRNLSVEVIIPPSITAYQFNFQSKNDQVVHQGDTLTYEITYGASESAGLATNTTIVVNYSSDKSPDNAYLVDYVIGSATSAYGGVQPVVDLQNRTITWTIPNLPAGVIDQKVRFQLQTNSSYTEQKSLQFVSRASLSNPYATFPAQYVSHEYLYIPSKASAQPTTTGLPQQTPTPTPISSSQFRLLDATITNLSSTKATLVITTNQASRATINYGISPAALSRSVEDASLQLTHELTIPNLIPNTPYYFKVTVTNSAGRKITSDIFTFTTPKVTGDLSFAGNDAITITSGGNILLSRILTSQSDLPYILLPTNTSYTATYTFDTMPPASELMLIISSENGIERQVQMSALDDYTYTAALRTAAPGIYQILLVQKDYKGNVVSRNVSYIKVVQPLRVFENGSGINIGDARVYLSHYDIVKKIFVPIRPGGNISIHNPLYTDKNGEVSFLLPFGTYRVEASALNYKTKAVTFTLGPKDGQEYPQIGLDKELLNISYLFNVFRDSLFDFSDWSLNRIDSVAQSIRFYSLTAYATMIGLILLGFLLFTQRTNISYDRLVPYVLFHLYVLVKKHKAAYIRGIVVNAENQPINDAQIEIVNITNATVLAHTTTDKQGRFQIRNDFHSDFIKCITSKDGYPVTEVIVPTNDQKLIQITLRKDNRTHHQATSILKEISGGFFEVILITCLVLELLYIESFGVMRTLPFIMLSFLNLILWIFYQRTTHYK